MSISIPGLGSGLDTEAIIAQLMSIEKRPQQLLQQKQATADAQLGAWNQIGTALQGLSSAVASLTGDKGWNSLATTSSSSSIATASAAATTAFNPGGTLRFKVDRLASAGSLVSTGSITGLDTVVASGNMLLARGTDRLGFSQLSSPTLAAGKYTMTVTQASQAASVTGATTAVPVTIDGTNDTLDVVVNGGLVGLTLAHGTYTSTAQLAAAVGTAAGGSLQATDEGGALKLATTRQGSQAALEISGGTAVTALGLTVGDNATGVDGRVSVGGVSTTIDLVEAGATVTLDGPSSTSITAQLSGPLVAGSTSLTSVATGGGTLTEVLNAVNRAGAGISAAAVQSSPGKYRLQFSAGGTGAGSNPMVSAGTLVGVSLAALSVGRDAQLTMGDGANAYQVTSSTNTFESLLPGVNVTAVKESADAVTVTANLDSSAVAAKVGQLVSAFNGTVSAIKSKYASSDPKNPAVLAGDASARRLVDRLYATFNSSSTSTMAMRDLGLSLSRAGELQFDSAKFTETFEANPSAAADAFKKVTTLSDTRLVATSVPTTLPPGSYTVNVTAAASRATTTGNSLAGGIATAETISIVMGSKTAQYAATAGETAAQIAAGLNAALVDKGIQVAADVTGGALRLRSTSYGSNVNFKVTTSTDGATQTGLTAAANVQQTFTGTDVTGTFTRGTTTVAATGRGQNLTADSADTVLKGLSVRVDADANDGPTFSAATLTYTAGLAQALNVLALNARDADGAVTSATNVRTNTKKDLDTQIASWTQRLKLREDTLRAQFTRLDKAMSQSNNQMSWLAGQISGLSANNSSK